VSEDREQEPDKEPLDLSTLSPFENFWRRVRLTWEYHGPWTVLFRVLTFPLRVTPLRHRLRVDRLGDAVLIRARRWYRRNGSPVVVVIPSYRDAELVRGLVRSIRRTTRRDRVRIVVSDDASGPEHLAALRRIRGIEVIASEQNTGFAATVNRGLRAADPALDVVLLNSDTVVMRHWLAVLQSAARADDAAIAGVTLLYPDGRIRSAGEASNAASPERFGQRFQFKPASYGPASVPQPVLALTGAGMYLPRTVLEELGGFDEDQPIASAAIDYCLRCWQSGRQVRNAPTALAKQRESPPPPDAVTAAEYHSDGYFSKRWGEFFDARNVRSGDGALRIVYVTESTIVGGGHRDVFEHLNRLAARGHDASLYTLDDGPDWFDLRVPLRTFADHDELLAGLEGLDAIKVATWWNTAAPVWLASVLHGIPVYFVQDIETSYYPDDEDTRFRVLASYREEFRYMTISGWNRDRLAELGLAAQLVAPGVDLGTFRPRPGGPRREGMVLALGRSNPLKNFPLTLAAWRALPDPRPELCLFGIEPELAGEPGIVYEYAPSDQRVNELMCEATVFVQTSTHEGFCLPVLEAMASGAAVVCTDAHGNRDFCVDGENCLMPAGHAEDVAAALTRLLADPPLRARLASAAIATAADYAWERRIDTLEQFLNQTATPHQVDLGSTAVPEIRKAPR
jgi:glycosyltransferase involved in cell wall biosynthesis